MKMVIAGSSGFIGRQLISYFDKQNQQLVLLSRKPSETRAYFWNPEQEQLDPSVLEGADVIINLCGESIFGRWTESKKRHIRESRLQSTQFLCDHILQLSAPPKLYINASAIGYYGDRGEEILTEESPPGEGFLADLCVEWEKIPEELAAKEVRVVITRFGMVLGEEGALHYMKKAFQSGMGGMIGNGRQMMSWIGIDDLCAALDHVIQTSSLSGPINFTAPNAVSNLEFTRTLGEQLNRPTLVSVPKFALNLLFGEGAEMFLASTHVTPQRLLRGGFQFQTPHLEEALKKYLHVKV